VYKEFELPEITGKDFCREIPKAMASLSVICSRIKVLLKRKLTSLRVE
jgi:hypothetical protein